ncbi:MAG: TIGR01777 family oxidoreductase [Terracidiphilus sp.]|jgi:uncharacterized protein (TIGR01777 family)
MDLTLAANAPAIRPRLRIVIPGGSGQVGQMLARHFQEQGHHVTVLTRSPYSASWQTVHWDGENEGSWIEHLEGADVCINLAGRSVNCRYTRANRRAIYESRIQSTRLLGNVIAGLADPPNVWINASAATLYRRVVDTDRVDLPLDEKSAVEQEALSRPEPWSSRRGFTPRVVRDWEDAFFAADTSRTRKITLRSAVVLSPAPGSAFGVLSNLVRASLGGTQGNGRQFVSWIHEADYARAVDFLLAHEELDGPFNFAAPSPLPNREFMAALRDAWDVPNGIPAPALAIRLGAILLRTEPELVLQSCRAVPGRLLDAGFQFDFPEWPEAAENLVQEWRHRND